MTKPNAFSGAGSALFLAPEPPVPGAGGGGLRSISVLEYLRTRYDVQIASFVLPYHSKSMLARVWRNGWRLVRGRPPLLDRFSGFEGQLDPVLRERHYQVAVIEHFWCAPYARSLRRHCERLVLDLHNVESELAASHARATRGLESMAHSRFAAAYRQLESEWLRHFDIVLVTSEEDRRRVQHPHVHVYPNALPEIARPAVPEANCILFSGNLEYHPNVEAVRWFRAHVWPRLRDRFPELEWRLAGSSSHGIANLVAGDERIRVLPPMKDAIPVLAEAKVCVVPLLSGSGTRFKILEAWAAARAVVSTRIGAEGLDAKSGEHLLIADSPQDFADAVGRLLEDPDLRARLGEAGRALYLNRFTWSTAWKELSQAGI
jgi:glycosyltransferase involved in cell wall biosynthesis